LYEQTERQTDEKKKKRKTNKDFRVEQGPLRGRELTLSMALCVRRRELHSVNLAYEPRRPDG